MADPEMDRVLDLLADDYARQILAHLSDQSMLVEALGEKCEGSESTIYRRLDELEAIGLVSETIQLDQQGHHRKRYETILTSVLVTFEKGRYDVELEIEEDTPDRFARMWGDIRGN